jgi:hypothetical protein
LIRAFWAAAWQDDIAGSPEFFFTVKVKTTDKTYEERSDHELTVSKDAAAGTAAGGTDTTGTAGTAGATLTLPAVGWSRDAMFAEETVDQVALLDKENTGKPASFVITPDENATLLWILLIPPRNDVSGGAALLKNTWKAPRYLPLENIEVLRLRATVGGKEVAATSVAKDVAERFPGQKGALFAEVRLHPGRDVGSPPDPSITLGEQQARANALMSAEPDLPKLKTALDAELAKWATDNTKNLSPTDSEYAFTLQEYAFQLVHDMSTSEVKPRPSGGKSLEKWKQDLRKSYLLGLMILTTGGKVNARESRTQLIASPLAEAGFITEAMNIVGLFMERKEQEFPYETILKQGGKATAAQWRTLLDFFIAGKGSFAATELVTNMGFGSGTVEIDGNNVTRLLPSTVNAFIQSLGANNTERNAKLDVIATALMNAYANDPDLVLALAGFLFFNDSYRQPFAERLWREDKGYLLFKILSTAEFIEPHYGGLEIDGRLLTMARDMAWVYENKQRFFTDFLVRFCERGGVTLPRAANLSFNTLRAWLEAQTETIAGAAPKVFPRDLKYWFDLYAMVTDIYFFHVDRGDVTPDLAGHIGGLTASDPNRLRLRADCDVFATYGARFLRAMGFTSIGYMGIWRQPDDMGHAGALLKKDDDFYVVNNKQAFKITAANEAAAHVKLRDSILDVLYDPAHYEVHYAAAGANGAMPQSLLDRRAATRRTDLEP